MRICKIERREKRTTCKADGIDLQNGYPISDITPNYVAIVMT